MHPIEHLRAIARAGPVPQDLLVRESAVALASFADDPVALVTACRRLVSRHPHSGVLWWFCSRLLCAPDPMTAVTDALLELDGDPTPAHLATALDEGATVAIIGAPRSLSRVLGQRGDLEVLVVDVAGDTARFVDHLAARSVDVVGVPLRGLGAAVAASDVCLIEALAVGPDGVLAASGSLAAAATAAASPPAAAWVVGGVGRILPAPVWEAMRDRLDPGVEPWDAGVEVVPGTLVDCVIDRHGVASHAQALSHVDCPIAPELFRPYIP